MSRFPLTPPSDFALSRYILGECTPEQKANIEAWLASSLEARARLEAYAESVLGAEQRLCQNEQAQWLIDDCFAPQRSRPVNSFTRPLFAFAAVLLLFVTGGTFMVSHVFWSQPDRTFHATAAAPCSAATLRDTLEALAWITRSITTPAVCHRLVSDVTAETAVTHRQPYSRQQEFGAELTAIFTNNN